MQNGLPALARAVTSCAAICLLLVTAGCGAEPPAQTLAEAPAVTEVPSVVGAPQPLAVGAVVKPRPLGHLPGPATEVTSSDGDIVARDGAGHEARLTATGMDMWPEVAPDGRTIVFSRGRDTRDGWPRDLYLARVDRGDPELLVAEDPDVHVDGGIDLPLHELARPDFSIDGRRVFFQIQNGFHNPGLCGIDLAARSHPAGDAEVVRADPPRASSRTPLALALRRQLPLERPGLGMRDRGRGDRPADRRARLLVDSEPDGNGRRLRPQTVTVGRRRGGRVTASASPPPTRS